MNNTVQTDHQQLHQPQSVSSQTPKLLQDALDVAAEVFIAKAFANLMTTLRLYVLPSFSFRGSAKASLDAYPSQILLKDFINAAQSYLDAAILRAIEQGKNPQTLANNRSIFSKFMELLLSQTWYTEFAKFQPIPKRAPQLKAGISLNKLRKGKRHYSANPYSLKEHELTDKLKKQLDALHIFLTAKYMPTRKGAPIRERSWHTNQERILHFLGWLKNEISFDISDLDIALMADKTT
jgi:hypothetical protein